MSHVYQSKSEWCGQFVAPKLPKLTKLTKLPMLPNLPTLPELTKDQGDIKSQQASGLRKPNTKM